MSTQQQIAESVVDRQQKHCEMRIGKIETAIESMREVSIQLSEFISESRQSRKSLQDQINRHDQTLYGTGDEKNKGVAGDVIKFNGDIQSLKGLVKSVAALILTVIGGVLIAIIITVIT